ASATWRCRDERVHAGIEQADRLAASARRAEEWPGMDRLRPCPTRPTPCVRLGCRPARSSFFRAGVRVVDGDFAALALADRHAGLAPGAVALPGDAGVVQHRPDGVRADVR